MAKITLTDVQTLQNESTVITTLKQNNDAIEAAMEKTLSRDGTDPNFMEANLDMNSNRILNLPTPLSSNEPARLRDLTATPYGALGTISLQDYNNVSITGGSITDTTSNTPVIDDSSTRIANTAFVLRQAGDANPTMDGVAAPGISPRYARQDHVHPVDTSIATSLALKANIASPTLTGTPAAPTAANGTSTTQIATTAFAANATNLTSGTITDARLPSFTQSPLSGAVNRTHLSKMQDVLNLKDLGAKGDGVELTATVTITSGSAALTAVGATFTSADVGKYISVQGAGTTGKYLVTTIAGFTDATHVTLTATASTTITAAAKTVCYGTDDAAVINAAISTAYAAGKSLSISDGIYFHSATIVWARPNFRVTATGARVIFKHVGTGAAHSLNGLTYGSGVSGVFSGVFGGPNRIQVHGNPSGGTTYGVYLNNWHSGELKVRIKDCQYGLYTQDTGGVAASAVCTTFDVVVSTNQDTFAYLPDMGIFASKVVYSNFVRPIIEGLGNTLTTPALYFSQSAANTIVGGTSEGNLWGGLYFESDSSGNTFIGFDAEANASVNGDMLFDATSQRNKFINCGAGKITINGSRNYFLGLECLTCVVSSGANDNKFIDCTFGTSFTDSGSRTVVQGQAGTATNKTPMSVLGLTDTAWTAFTPTITAQSGTITTSSATGRYKQIGKVVFCEYDISITAAGTGTGSILATIPVAAASFPFTGSSYEYAITAKAGHCTLNPLFSATTVLIRAADVTTYIVNTYKVVASITYEAA